MYMYMIFNFFFLEILKFNPRSSKNSVNDDVVNSSTVESDLNVTFLYVRNLPFYKKQKSSVGYIHLYITIKPLDHRSLIHISFEFGDLFDRNNGCDLVTMGNPLTLKNTQYGLD